MSLRSAKESNQEWDIISQSVKIHMGARREKLGACIEFQNAKKTFVVQWKHLQFSDFPSFNYIGQRNLVICTHQSTFDAAPQVHQILLLLLLLMDCEKVNLPACYVWCCISIIYIAGHHDLINAELSITLMFLGSSLTLLLQRYGTKLIARFLAINSCI